MDAILNFVRVCINPVIIILGLGLTVLVLMNALNLSFHRSRIEEAVRRRNKKYMVNPSDGTMEEDDDEDAAVTPDTIRNYEMEFNKACSLHSVYTQLIPIFPLLGILGTVAGLMLQLGSQDVAAIFDSLGVALSSTFAGLIFSILLKSIDAVYPARIIGDVDVLLEDYSKKLDMAEMLQRLQAQEGTEAEKPSKTSGEKSRGARR